MKRFMVVTAILALAAPIGCGKSGDRAMKPASQPSEGSGQQTAWNDAPSAAGQHAVEVHPSPGIEQPPGSLPMTADGALADSRTTDIPHTDLKAPPVMVGPAREGVRASAQSAQGGAVPRSAQAPSPRNADALSAPADDSQPRVSL